MAVFNYKAINTEGREVTGTIDAISRDVAIASLQRRGFVIESVSSGDDVPFLERNLSGLFGISRKNVVILSRQIATLFEAQISALRVFTLLAQETQDPQLADILNTIVSDLKGGSSIAKALSKHPKAFSDFYVNTVRVGEESGKLDQVFMQLADHMDRSYELVSKARNALIYPSFVIITFIAVMTLMLTAVIPRISDILLEAGQELPIYTRIVLGISDFFVNFGIFVLIAVIVGVLFLIRYVRTEEGKRVFSEFKLAIPYVGTLYRKLYLSRIADSLQTMLLAGVPVLKALESTSVAVDNITYEEILKEAAERVRGGSNLSAALSGYDEMPSIMTQMMKVGEETGELGSILETVATFYRREVSAAVDTLVDLIEPAMIVILGVGVGVLLASVLLPIYNISAGI